ncbi:MAG: OmcA/MtrC family decaheme c-type cytochrome [Steroidobacteraceae bacterium]
MALIAMMALATAAGVAGCGGSGAKGPEQPSGGGSGGTGPTGPTGPTNPPISEGGDVAGVGNGSGLTAQQIQDIRTLIATIDTATVEGGKPALEFTVKTSAGGAVLGLAPATLRLGVAKLIPAADNQPARWQSYINRVQNGTIPSPALPSAVQANVETGGAAGSTWTELGGGRYRYVGAVNLTTVTTPIVVTYEPTLTHRYSISIQLSGSASVLDPDNPHDDFVPAGGAVTDEKLVSATSKCAACHVRFAEHGGPRRTVEFCDVCHNAATTDPDSGQSVDLAYMAHSIHMGEHRSTPYIVYGFGNTEFNAGDITYPQPLTFCENCHSASAATPQGDDWQTSPGTAQCGGCHAAGVNKTGPSATTGTYTYTYTHSTPVLPPGYTAEDGWCKDCHRAGGAAGSIYDVHAQDPARKAIVNGDLYTYEIVGIQNAAVGQAPRVTFRILQGGVPMDVKAITTGRLRLDFGWTAQDIHNIADIAGDQYQVPRGTALTVDLIANMASVVDNGDGTYSYTLGQALPSGFSDPLLGTGLMVVLEGRRVMPDGSNAYPPSAYAFAGGTAPRKLVDEAKCNACHVRVAAHGGSRAGDPKICTVCHSPSAGGTFNTNSFGPLSLGAFIHNVHDSKIAAVGAITYPQELARCMGCHVEGSVNTAPATALPITVDAGTTALTGAAAIAWKDDLADSATAGACASCHDSTAAKDHMTSQGGSFAVPKTLVPSSAQEGCALCHGAGQAFDTVTEHCKNLPVGQCAW